MRIRFLLLSICITFLFGYANAQQDAVLSVNLTSSQELVIAIQHNFHLRYGFMYPMTYQIDLPADANGLTVERKNSITDSWTAIPKKESIDLFNAIEAFRIDGVQHRAWVSAAFSSQTDSLYLRFMDASGASITPVYRGISKYYDNRTAAVTVTADDWCTEFVTDFLPFLNLFRSYGIYVTVGVITQTPELCSNEAWQTFQAELDSGYVEAAGHSRNHFYQPPTLMSPPMSYEDAVLGCYDDIVNKLRLPPLYRMGYTQYIYTWIAPQDYNDHIIDGILQQRSYLIPRVYEFTNSPFFSEWVPDQRHFRAIWPTLEIGDHNWRPHGIINIDTLNAKFDLMLRNEGIYHLMAHPHDIIKELGKAYFINHLRYISRRGNIWYVNFGHLYLYHLLQLKNTTGIPLPDVPSLKEPATNTQKTPTALTFYWNASSAGSLYQLQLSAISDFSTLHFNKNGITTASFSMDGLATGTTYFWRVRAVNASGASNWSSVRNFTTTLGPPAPVSPANDEKTISLNPVVRWRPAPGASSYRLQVSIDSSFTNTQLVFNSAGLTDTTREITGLAFNTAYFWRVNASNALETSAWSNVWRFNTKLAPPALAYPLKDSKKISLSPTLSWNASAWAGFYGLQVSLDSTFSELSLVIDTTCIADTTKSLTNLAGNTTYFWRVNAANNDGTSDWSIITGFSTTLAPTNLDSPKNKAVRIPSKPVFKWHSSNGASSYWLQISRDSTFSNQPFVCDSNGIADTMHVASDLADNTVYFWRVVAQTEMDTSVWSSVWCFTSILKSPTLDSPVDQATGVSLKPVLKWRPSGVASSYQLQVTLDSTFSQPSLAFQAIDIQDTSKEITGLSWNTAYYWRVAAETKTDVSAWSSIWSFKTLPESPLLDFPANKASGISLNPVLRWYSSGGSSVYRLQVSLDSTFSNPPFVCDLSGFADTLRIVQNLAKNTSYFWRVAAETNGVTGKWSGILKFTTAPEAPGLHSPPDDIKGIMQNPTLAWHPSAGALSYRVQVSMDSTFLKPPFPFDSTGIIDTTRMVSVLLGNTAYYWRVSSDPAPDSCEWSSVWSFTVCDTLSAACQSGGSLPDRFDLGWNYPNPFNSQTKIPFTLPRPEYVTIKVYNLTGKEVATLIAERLAAGTYQTVWNAEAEASGIYWCQMEAGSFRETKKMLFLK